MQQFASHDNQVRNEASEVGGEGGGGRVVGSVIILMELFLIDFHCHILSFRRKGGSSGGPPPFLKLQDSLHFWRFLKQIRKRRPRLRPTHLHDIRLVVSTFILYIH
jgi:hypothetical protein